MKSFKQHLLAISATLVAPLLLGCMWVDGTTLEGKLKAATPGEVAAPAYQVDDKHRSWRDVERLANQLRDIIKLTPAAAQEMMDEAREQDIPIMVSQHKWPQALDAPMRLIFAGKIPEAKQAWEALLPTLEENYFLQANLAVTSELTPASEWRKPFRLG